MMKFQSRKLPFRKPTFRIKKNGHQLPLNCSVFTIIEIVL